jgi:hypothetical protein
MTKKELVEALREFDDDNVVVCMCDGGAWDNIKKVKLDGPTIIAIEFN